ncbi:sigma factor-like helix-turn-helix DNA-binding protein [Lysinibacillus odysseyi]|uniref:RNA polymerase sigma-70 region 4 domain-containing protein n=1 Tax=Lysinibacillus odysseyi 34hs-1 = NBRC 100172 TaxID=1220589 RepID=A0A0A3JGQ9_9BACI|nr:sigma factor-like helix-turn-helix DNA-binding protein [Lysinibacillus odysseyi]KGR86202.1 hypothetical protein CD32_07365 [Lysinibacillus odysseyi 34hs-1 = NBRC 100172]
MYQLNKSILNSSIFESFVAAEENEKIYMTFINEPTLANKEKLEAAFTTHTKLILAISYLKKVIYFESRRFDKKRRELENKQPVILNAPTEENITLLDMIADENAEYHFDLALEVNIEEVITDGLLIKAVRGLSDRQKEILYYRYVLNCNDTMIAEKYNVSQQAITKSHRKALQKLREALE